MVVQDSIVQSLNVEEDGTGLTCSLASNIISQLPGGNPTLPHQVDGPQGVLELAQDGAQEMELCVRLGFPCGRFMTQLGNRGRDSKIPATGSLPGCWVGVAMMGVAYRIFQEGRFSPSPESRVFPRASGRGGNGLPQALEARWKQDRFRTSGRPLFSPSQSLCVDPALTSIENGPRGDSGEGRGTRGQPVGSNTSSVNQMQILTSGSPEPVRTGRIPPL
ncbi:Peroxiredoxin-5, mitochondrial, partial [Ophiophagus hannah]